MLAGNVKLGPGWVELPQTTPVRFFLLRLLPDTSPSKIPASPPPAALFDISRTLPPPSSFYLFVSSSSYNTLCSAVLFFFFSFFDRAHLLSTPPPLPFTRHTCIPFLPRLVPAKPPVTHSMDKILPRAFSFALLLLLSASGRVNSLQRQ